MPTGPDQDVRQVWRKIRLFVGQLVVCRALYTELTPVILISQVVIYKPLSGIRHFYSVSVFPVLWLVNNLTYNWDTW